MGRHGEEAEALVSPGTTRIYHGEDLGERMPKAERCPRWGGQHVVSEPPFWECPTRRDVGVLCVPGAEDVL